MRRRRFASFVLAAAVLQALPAGAEDKPPRRERIQFGPGASGAIVRGQVHGYDVVDYLLGAGAGQRMTVILVGDNLSGYFNVTAPGAPEALPGAATVTRFDGTLPVAGDYTIRVYLMRNAARRDETMSFTLAVAIGA